MTSKLVKTAWIKWVKNAGCLLWAASFCLPAFCIPAVADQTEAITPVTLSHAEQWTLHSKATKHDYLIQVAKPSKPPSASGYPVLYVLDGNALFPMAVISHNALTVSRHSGDATPWLIVGIGYPNTERYAVKERSEDYTPALIANEKADSRGRPIGGADRFYDFVQHQLKPLISQKYKIDPSRQAILGHSYGGLFTLYTLSRHPQAFSDFLAISPSLWWQEGKLVETFANQSSSAGSKRVLVGQGELEVAANHPRLDQSNPRQSVDTQAFVNDLKTSKPNWLVHYEQFAGARHGNVMWPAMPAVWQFLSPIPQSD